MLCIPQHCLFCCSKREITIQSTPMRRPGFTLIELVVVITIIGLLLAMVFPLVSRIRRHSRSVLCQANQRQLLLAFSLYQNHENRLPWGEFARTPTPPPGGFPGDQRYDPAHWWWFHYLGFKIPTVLNQKFVLFCPSKKLDSVPLHYNELWGNYGVNRSLCKSSDTLSRFKEFRGKSVSPQQIHRPTETMLLMDAGFSLISWYHATETPPEELKDFLGVDVSYVPGLMLNHQRNLSPAIREDAQQGRHPGKTVNIGFVDGHVEKRKAEALRVDKRDNGIYDNLYPGWVPRRPARSDAP